MNPILRAMYGGVGVLAQAAVAAGVPGDGKFARTVMARRGLRERYEAFVRTTRDASRPLIWVHAPSVGEGLQALPVLERLHLQRPEVQQAYTHFSPSAAAFAQRTGADFRDVIPFDVASEMRVALDALHPDALVFSKLDVWPVLVAEAAQRGVQLGIISATVAAASRRLTGVAAMLTRDAYAAMHAVGAVDDADAARLVQLGVRESVIRVTGDTRYDQVWARARTAETTAPWLTRFRAVPRVTLIAGSTWPGDEEVLLPAWRDLCKRWPGQLRLIIAPHEPTAAHLSPIEASVHHTGLSCVRFDANGDTASDVVLVDRVGVLGDLYALADVAYVGGGFHAAGLHSVLEPAAFGAPVLFGPKHTSSRDATLLLAAGAAHAVSDARSLGRVLDGWLDPSHSDARRLAGSGARDVVERGLGAADASTALVLSLLRAGGVQPRGS
jgi:3-deoxy-D-manno-octulosonic-acid transferase